MAQFVAAGRLFNHHTIVRNDEIVVIPEGTSGLYVGLALAAYRKRLQIYTSNAALIREYQDNPCLARRLKALHVLGGTADPDAIQHGGLSGTDCQLQYEQVVQKKPPATIIIMTVSSLTADYGPCVDGQTAAIKAAVIVGGLAQNVREVVFVCDYSKHISEKGATAAIPLFAEDRWRMLVEKHPHQIRIVTAPPPALRAILLANQGRDVVKRNLAVIAGPIPFTDIDWKYNSAAVALRASVGAVRHGDQVEAMFNEAYQVISCSKDDNDDHEPGDPKPVRSVPPPPRLGKFSEITCVVNTPHMSFQKDLFADQLKAIIGEQLDPNTISAIADGNTQSKVTISATPVVIKKILDACNFASTATRKDLAQKARIIVVQGYIDGKTERVSLDVAEDESFDRLITEELHESS